jgi:tRNA pseudouridine38-40 synthase
VAIKLSLQYDGSGFAGLELQPGQRTVRSELAKALKKLYKRAIPFITASRTDAGVHALGQVISYRPPLKIPLDKLPVALNSVLPEDIRIVKAEAKGQRPKAEGFHARYDAKAKEYEYLIFNGPIMPPHLRHLAWQVKPKLDIAAMKKASKYLVGRHDFSSFCAADGDDRDFVRTIHSLGIRHLALGIWPSEKHRVISVKVRGNGFLYKMVRNIVGTLVEVGLGRRKPEEAKTILIAKDRKKAGKTAPAYGLCLLRVDY